jgi:putative ABC transport system permease protein
MSMAIPFVYNLRSMRRRWSSGLVAVLGIAGAVTVFVAMLAMARGFASTLVAAGSPANAIVTRAGATSEIYSSLRLEQVQIIENTPGVARGKDGPLASAEVVELATFTQRKTGIDANLQVRGVSPQALAIRDRVHVLGGRFFKPGLAEIVVGRNVAGAYVGLELGSTVKFGGGVWTVVGVLDAGGSAFDSELWCDAVVLNQVYKRPENAFESVTVRLASPEGLQQFKDALTSNPRLAVQVERESDYYEKTSRSLTSLLRMLGLLIAAVMGVGAVLAALNTMVAAVAERAREIATLRALGFGAGSVVLSFLFEALLLAAGGGVLGCLVALPMNGYTTEVMNWETVSHVAFAFRITPSLLLGGAVFALVMGVLGGVTPAIHAARQPVALTLRKL